MIIMEAFRLPFIEMEIGNTNISISTLILLMLTLIGLYDKAIESFKECALESGLYAPYSPIPIRKIINIIIII